MAHPGSSLCSNFVPISLLVTLELIKFWQGSFMQWDVSMFDGDQGFGMRAQCTNINEELGQVQYIFSDKTGTLTCNIMEFLHFSTREGSFTLSKAAAAPGNAAPASPKNALSNRRGSGSVDRRNMDQIDGSSADHDFRKI